MEEILYLRKNHWLQVPIMCTSKDNRTNPDDVWNCTFEVTREELSGILTKTQEFIKTRNPNILKEYFHYADYQWYGEELSDVIEQMEYFYERMSEYLRTTGEDYYFYYNSTW